MFVMCDFNAAGFSAKGFNFDSKRLTTVNLPAVGVICVLLYRVEMLLPCLGTRDMCSASSRCSSGLAYEKGGGGVILIFAVGRSWNRQNKLFTLLPPADVLALLNANKNARLQAQEHDGSNRTSEPRPHPCTIMTSPACRVHQRPIQHMNSGKHE